MGSQKGLFVWYELLTTDVDAAVAFYGQVVGWGNTAMPMPGMDYRMFQTPQGNNCGVMALPQQARAMGAPSHWLGYISVDDLDASVARVVAAGGKVLVPAMAVPGVGRFSTVADPQGAVVAFLTPDGEPSPMHDRSKAGEFCWHELLCSDPPAALAFYGVDTGWVGLEQMDMGPEGTYDVFGLNAEQRLGGMMKRPAHMAMSAWNYYINVADLDGAMARADAAGGHKLLGPQDVPGGRIAVYTDPQGAAFALMGK